MFLDDLIESCQHRGNGVVRRADVPLWIAARQLLHQVSHGVLPCIATRGQKNLNCGLPLGKFCTRSRMAYFPALQHVVRKN
jgi:hypothetical protein